MKPLHKLGVALGVFLAFAGGRMALYTFHYQQPALVQDQVIADITIGLLGLLLLWFVAAAWRDLAMLAERPLRAVLYVGGLVAAVAAASGISMVLFAASANSPALRGALVLLLPLAYVMVGVGARLVLQPSPGIGRVLAVARHAVAEAWAARVWAVLILWAIAAAVQIALTRPFDESERIAEYLSELLRTQELIVLVFVAVLACLSFPRERDRRTVITTASKPLSRMEYFLGKVFGFMVVALGLLTVMGIASWLFLVAADSTIKANARRQVTLIKGDVDMKRVERLQALATQSGMAAVEMDQANAPITSMESLRRLSEEGALSAQNYVTGEMQVLGKIEYSGTQATPNRYIRGAYNEKVIYRFPQKDDKGKWQYVWRPGAVVRLGFQYVVAGARWEMGGSTFFKRMPPEIELRVTVRSHPAGKEQEERTVRLQARQPLPDDKVRYTGDIELPSPERFLPFNDPKLGFQERPDVSVEISCAEPDVFLAVGDPAMEVTAANAWLINLDGTGMMQPCTLLPKVYGWEKRDKQQFRGPEQSRVKYESGERVLRMPVNGVYPKWDDSNDEVAAWHFKNVKRGDLPLERGPDGTETFRIAMQLDVEKQDNNIVPARVKAVVHRKITNINDPKTYWTGETNIDEKRVMYLKVPASLLEDAPSDVYVELRSMIPGHWLAAVDSSVRLDQANSPFVANLFKSELIIFLEAALLVMVAVTCSIRLGWAVAMLLTATVYLLGNCFAFIREMQDSSLLQMMGLTPGGGGEPGMLYRIVDGMMALMFKILNTLAYMVPDFSRFDPTSFIVDSRNIPWLVMLEHAAMIGLWIIPCVAVGYLMIRKQELA